MKYIYLMIIVIGFSFTSCKKFLDKIPNDTDAIPASLSDLQAILDNYIAMNKNYPDQVETMADNFYVSTADWSSVSSVQTRNYYIWQKDDFTNVLWSQIWGNAIKNANVVIDVLPTISSKPEEENIRNDIKGSALFLRGFYYLATAQLFAQPYDKNTAGTDLGLPLRLNSDFNEPSVRSSVQQTYNQIIKDLELAADLLPLNQILKTRPTKAAAYGALARTYLAMQQYDLAGKYANLCLENYQSDNLMDFNTLIATDAAPIKRFNKEVIFHCLSGIATFLSSNRAKVDDELYKSYNQKDLRKSVYFKNYGNDTFQFKGDYDGLGTSNGIVFSGIVADEMYLIKSESYARAGNIKDSLHELNTLMETRWTAGEFVPFIASDDRTLLTLVLTERRKELLFRGTRWTDLRRLMKDEGYTYTPKRVINGITYELPPNSPRFTLQLPGSVIDLTGMPQNP